MGFDIARGQNACRAANVFTAESPMMRERMHQRSAQALLAIAVLMSSAPALADSSPVRSLLEMRHANVVIQQWDISCGAAALATVLTYQLDHPISEKQVAQGMLRRTDPLRVRHRGGFSLLDMKRYAESRGFHAEGYARLSLENLRKLAPLIVPVNLEGYDHFVVFRGIAAGRAVLADPGFGNRTVALDEFEQAWNGRIGFVVQPRRASPGNRIPPRKTDLLAVQDEAVRVAMDSDLPRPLRDWQMADLPWSVGPPPEAGDRAAPAAPLSPVDADNVVAGSANIAPLWMPPVMRGGPSALGSTAQAVNTTVTPAVNLFDSAAEASGAALAPVASAAAPVARAAGAVAAPAANAVAPVTNVVAPVTNAVAPVTNAVAPVTNAVAPVTNAVAPVTNAVVAPVTRTAAPVATAVAPAVQATTPAVAPITATVSPATQSLNTTTAAATSPVTQALTGSPVAAPTSQLAAPVTPVLGGGLPRR
jgi:uncharacterized protein